ncbi:hypothetical protein Pyn_33815 [Prunus yedoensis var. nudiflora]|uniref:Uncharacterized protein n=1 Tax=Prunus yedoensis var. nudiflora TaxID=2094558 RepID=A0A314Y5I1_PRUYE|nr:hypothetical protein Pyn_33815 [Prunus yedoensis var. nudiflora]
MGSWIHAPSKPSNPLTTHHYSHTAVSTPSLVLSTSSTQNYLRNLVRRLFVVFPTSSSHKLCAPCPGNPNQTRITPAI